MRKIRAVVEISVPDKSTLTEAGFAKALRRNLAKSVSLAPAIKEARPIEFKEFNRVVQYGPDGRRIVATKPPSPFESLVLFGLWVIVRAMITPRQLSKAPRLEQWFKDVRATLAAAEPQDEEEPWEHPDKKAAREEQLALHDETVATAQAEGRIK